MKIRETILAVYVLLACVSCVRDKPTEKEAGAAPLQVASAPTSASVQPEAKKPVMPSEVAYDDKVDLPANAGDARCKDPMAANAKPARVKLELTTNPPGVELSIASLGVQQKLWPGATNPKECRASLDSGGAAYRFRCSDDTTAIDGKIYARKSDLVLGRATTAGAGSTKFIFPCGTPPKLEPVACPKECKKDGDRCVCSAK